MGPGQLAAAKQMASERLERVVTELLAELGLRADDYRAAGVDVRAPDRAALEDLRKREAMALALEAALAKVRAGRLDHPRKR